MGTICILLGLILLVLATLGGFLISHAIASSELIMSLMGMSSVSTVYAVTVSACFVVGLLICLSLVMNGLIYNRLSKQGKTLQRLTRNH